MFCKCGGKTKVKETRTQDSTVYRRRICKKCGRELFTVEKISKEPIEIRYAMGKVVSNSKGEKV